jgi:hypothetical protein
VWWLLFVGGFAGTTIGAAVTGGDVELEEMKVGYIIYACGYACWVVSAVMGAIFVDSLTATLSPKK